MLNAVRDEEIGIPLTFTQWASLIFLQASRLAFIQKSHHRYTRLTPKVLTNRLVQRHHHLLALRICESLKLDTDRVLTHWASVKVIICGYPWWYFSGLTQNDAQVKHTVGDDERVSTLIVEKLGADKSGISYAEVAKVAYTSGHTKLATRVNTTYAKCILLHIIHVTM